MKANRSASNALRNFLVILDQLIREESSTNNFDALKLSNNGLEAKLIMEKW